MKSILVVEGDPIVRNLFCAAFKQDGWETQCPANAESATVALNSDAIFDIILLSYRIVGTDGITLSRFIRGLPHHTNTPILMITGTGGLNLEAMTVGINLVLPKPIDLVDLLAAVDACLADRDRPSLGSSGGR